MARITKAPAAIYPIDSVLQGNGELELFVAETWNQKCWAYGMDMTCVSKGNTQLGIRGAGTLVTPRHAFFANHFHPAEGTTLRWLTRTNQIVDVVLKKLTRVEKSDLMIGELDSDVKGVTPAKLLPPSLVTPKVGEPLLYVNQVKMAIVAELQAWSLSVLMQKALMSKIRGKFYRPVQVYDSGHPIFLVRDNQIFLVSHLTTSSGGPNYFNLRSSIEAIIQQPLA